MKKRTPPTLLPAVALAALGAVVAIPTLSSSFYAASPTRYAVTTVQRGDDLWTIAARYTPRGGSVQDVVDSIQAANHVDVADLRPGEHLRIPR